MDIKHDRKTIFTITYQYVTTDLPFDIITIIKIDYLYAESNSHVCSNRQNKHHS